MSSDVKAERGEIIRRLLILLVSGEAVVAGIILLITKKIIVLPLAEYLAFAYTYGAGGNTAGCVFFAALFVIALALVVLSAFPVGERYAIKSAAAVFVFVDFAIHSYVFLASSGYGWNYLASAALDVVLLVCILFSSRAKKEVKDK